ncbi:MAG TPA: hypothetical protein VGV37_01925 [Aliidongia sp.]|uniref:hypothetical protein n=1 Tax=Aliidongia sp. TaxID=1914230 RepID=UPI002DDCFC74|nr:hypothetical protein [Aliidongia sp.]HEV2673269.1 hypothetical protein [Aliidongia sp.]
MWIFMNDAMLSIVELTGQQDELLVRARMPGDLERAFPDAEVSESLDRDYRFRAVISRKTVAAAIADRICAIDYPNFKSSIGNHGDHSHERHHAYFRVWHIMNDVQHSLLNWVKPAKRAGAR